MDSAIQLIVDEANAPSGAKALTVVLAHGAGAPMDSGFMNRMAAGLAERGWRVARFEFPYMARRRLDGKRRGPDRAAVLEEHWRAVIDQLAPAEDLVIGGKSMGGRIASMVADAAAVRGLVCLGYPFHPPGRPERLRTAHLRELGTPTLIVQGTRDTLGNRDEIAGYELSPRIDVRFLEDGDHSFKPRVRSGRTLEQNMTEGLEAIDAFLKKLQSRARPKS